MKNPNELSTVAQLRLARAYMAEHGFSPGLRSGECRCFIGALDEVAGGETYTLALVTLMPFVPGQSFDSESLRSLKVTKEQALAAFDAVIANEESKA